MIFKKVNVLGLACLIAFTIAVVSVATTDQPDASRTVAASRNIPSIQSAPVIPLGETPAKWAGPRSGDTGIPIEVIKN